MKLRIARKILEKSIPSRIRQYQTRQIIRAARRLGWGHVCTGKGSHWFGRPGLSPDNEDV